MLIKTYQRAIAGGRRAGKKIVRMILERQKRRELRGNSNRQILRMRWMR